MAEENVGKREVSPRSVTVVNADAVESDSTLSKKHKNDVGVTQNESSDRSSSNADGNVDFDSSDGDANTDAGAGADADAGAGAVVPARNDSGVGNPSDNLVVSTNSGNSSDRKHGPQLPAIGGIALNRETVTVAGLSITIGLLATCAGTIAFGMLAAILTSPLWIPFAVITCPFWVPFAFLSSPLWVSALAIGVICFLWAAFFAFLAFSTFLFFSWPAKWLPKDSDKTEWFLQSRNQATVALVKLQAKLVLYAAGVGPLADAALAITDRIDLAELQKALSEFDLAQFAEDVKKMDIKEIQAALINAIRSFVGM